MEFERIPTVPTAEEVLDRSFRRAAVRMRQKRNKDRANEEFVRAVCNAVHDRLVSVIQSFPDFDTVPRFYQDVAEILFGIQEIRKALGAVGWAAKWARDHGPGFAYQTRKAEITMVMRKRAVARLSSVVRQVGEDLLYLNNVRNVLRKLPHVEDCFTVVICGYPNVGKSSFIRAVSSADPEIASYPFTTKGIVVGHRAEDFGRIQFVDTPGLLDRPQEERNAIEQQAVAALINLADVVLFIIDPSGHGGYPLDDQLRLLEDLQKTTQVPIVVVANKSDIIPYPGHINMSAETGLGIEQVLHELITKRLRESGTSSFQAPQ